jgi:hypothetical protein
MSNEGTKGLVDKLRGARDSAMADVARVTLAWTSSDAYQAVNAAISKPLLLMTAVFRQAREAAMADVLAALNVPSRADVLALSQRLTRIEMALDDVGAGMEDIRRATRTKQQPAPHQHESNGEGRAPARPG